MGAELEELSIRALEGDDVHGLLGEVTRVVAQGLGADIVTVLEFDEEKESFCLRASCGLEADLADRVLAYSGLGSQAGFTLWSGRSVVVPNLLVERRFDTSPALVGYGVRSGMSVPILCSGRSWGVLEIYSVTTDAFCGPDTAFAKRAARLLSGALRRERKDRETGDLHAAGELRELAALAEVAFFVEATNALRAAADQEDAAEAVARLVVPSLADGCAVEILNGNGLSTAPIALALSDPDFEPYARPISAIASVGTQRVINTGEHEIVPTLEEDRGGLLEAALNGVFGRAVSRAASSYLGVPIRVNRRVQGAVLLLMTSSGRSFEEETHLQKAQFLADLLALRLTGADPAEPDGHAPPRRRFAPEPDADQDSLPERPDGGEQPAAPAMRPYLTEREFEILAKKHEHKSTPEIARDLHLSQSTIKQHLKNVRTKLGVQNTPDALRAAETLGILG